MMAAEPSRLARFMTWLAVGLTAALLALGIFVYGWSPEVHHRFWADLFDRIHGPMTFRFYLQPCMAAIAALTDGIADARHGHQAFFWTARHHAAQQYGRLRQGLVSTARILLLGISMDVIYQFKVFDRFYPAEAAVMAIGLAVIPYFIFRWIVEQIARRWLARQRGLPS